MLRHFVIVWLLYWGVVAILPVHSIYPATFEAFLLQLAFVLLVVLAMWSTLSLFGVRRLPDARTSSVPHAQRLVWIAMAMSIVGLAALMYDKLFIQGIDYSDGVVYAREEWRRVGEEREGQVSSIFSLVGYLFGSAYYVAAILAITQAKALSNRARTWSLMAAFGLVMANSALTGGRSNLLLLAAVLIGTFAARRGISWRLLFTNRSQRRLIGALAFLGAVYTVFIFYQRADAGEVDSLEYVIDFLPFLGLEAADWYRDSLDGGMLGSLSAMLVLAISYVTHSFATVAAIMDAPTEDKTIIFLHASNIFYKLGFIERPDGGWFLTGRFPSVPGALWHRLGAVGFVLGSAALGVACALTKVWTVRAPERLLALGSCAMADAALLMSPALFAGDFLSFPFVLASFVMLDVFAGYLPDAKEGERRRSAPGAGPGRRVRPSIK